MNKLKKAAHYLWLHAWKYRVIEGQHQRYLEQLRRRERVNVVFTAIDVTLWRYQHVYELMAADGRFNVSIVLTPCTSRLHADEDVEGLRRYFSQRGMKYVDFDFGGKPFDIKRELNPDIIFYTQPYEYLLEDEHDCRRFYDRLVCYVPYAFWTATGKLAYDLHFHNLAWRLYYSTTMHLEDARRMAGNQGRNVRVTGYPNADDYLCAEHKSPWRVPTDGRQRKRIIWAPHYSIKEKSTFAPRSNFLRMADLMVSLAREYADSVQFAFKPHPALLTQLYEDSQWGRERTDAYYDLWRTMPNTQPETGAFIDLFMTSDAMIHDSASFSVEYHYTRKPVMFIAADTQPILEGMNDFGKKAFALHYLGKDEADIRRFIDDTVLGGNDPMLPQREQFFHDYLLPPGGKSVARNIYESILGELGVRS